MGIPLDTDRTNQISTDSSLAETRRVGKASGRASQPRLSHTSRPTKNKCGWVLLPPMSSRREIEQRSIPWANP